MAVNPIILQRCREEDIPELTDLVLKAIEDGVQVASYPELCKLIDKRIWELSDEAKKAIDAVSIRKQAYRLRRIPFDVLKDAWIESIVLNANKKIEEVAKWKKIKEVSADIFKDFVADAKKFQDAG